MKKPEHSSRKHSEFSPSSAERWMKCPGSIRLGKSAPPQRESFYAREGTEAHECLEFLVKRFSNLDGARVEAARKYPLEMVSHGVESARRIFSPDLRPSPEAKLLVESRVKMQLAKAIWGTLDYAWVDLWGTLAVADYKYGVNPVLPVGEDGTPNPQLMIYAHGLAERHDFDFTDVKLAIIQPRAWSESGDGVTHATVSIKRLREFGLEVAEAVKRASSPGAPLVSGSHCKYCPAVATCPELSRKALDDANIVFDTDVGIVAAPSAQLITAKTLPGYLKAADQLDIWIKELRAVAYQLAEDGEEIPGYKLVPKRASRIWAPEARTRAEMVFGAAAFEIETRFLSPAQLEKKIGKKNAEKFVNEFTSSVSSGFALVPESDKRGEVHSTLAFDHE